VFEKGIRGDSAHRDGLPGRVDCTDARASQNADAGMAERFCDGVVRDADAAPAARIGRLAAVRQDLPADRRQGLEDDDAVPLSGELEGRRAARHARTHHEEALHSIRKVVRGASSVLYGS